MFRYFVSTIVDITDRLHPERASRVSRLTSKIISRFDYRLNKIVEGICDTTMGLTRTRFSLCNHKDPVTGRSIMISETAPSLPAWWAWSSVRASP